MAQLDDQGRPLEDVDYFYGHRSTDITKRYGIQVPKHSGHPSLRNKPDPYYVIPQHDLTDKFRRRLRDWGRMVTSNAYHGRRVSEITDPAKIPGNWKGAYLGPYPPSSTTIGDPNFTRYEYLNPLGKKKPSPMDDYVPLRDRYGRPVRGRSPSLESTQSVRRRLLGLLPDECHRNCPNSRPRTPEQQCQGQGQGNDIQIAHPRFHFSNSTNSPKKGRRRTPEKSFDECYDEKNRRPNQYPTQNEEADDIHLRHPPYHNAKAPNTDFNDDYNRDYNTAYEMHSNRPVTSHQRAPRRRKQERSNTPPVRTDHMISNGNGNCMHRDAPLKGGSRARQFDVEDFDNYGRYVGRRGHDTPNSSNGSACPERNRDNVHQNRNRPHTVGSDYFRSHNDGSDDYRGRPCECGRRQCECGSPRPSRDRQTRSRRR